MVELETVPRLERLGIRALSRAAQVGAACASILVANAAETAPPQVSGSVETGSVVEPDMSVRKLELHGVQEEIEAARNEGHRIEAEIAAIRTDRAKLTARLLETAEAASTTEHQIAEKERRLDGLLQGEESIKSSLARQRGVIAEVLAALQRMGRKPPPALLAAPDDMLRTIRTAMLLGAVVPDLQSDVEALGADLADLVALRRSIAAERVSLAEDAARLKSERAQLAALVEARQSALDLAEKALGTEQRRMADLGRRSADLGDLIGRMETEIEAASRAAAAAREADALRKSKEKDQRPTAPFADPARLAPAVAFVEAKGLLPLPVSGTLLRSFGHKDGFGGTEKGMLITTRAGAFVTSPCDGWVSYAGPYRGYGQLLIVNAGQGYYIILAGMDRINVNVGQFVLAGEPVALMGDRPTRTAAALAVGAAHPTLYVEFRKDGTAIDPGPWWAKAELQKVRG
jgi:septal ring factor EnvC (AmiA/AmiB activator)